MRVLTNLFHISTHSLTRRLTERCFLVKQVNNHFNSQPHEEADNIRQQCNRIHAYFNSQPHEEADERLGVQKSAISNFNSQPHEEADFDDGNWEETRGYFNSQPHEEADNLLVLPTADPGHFNSQPHEEADYNTYYIGTCNIISTHSLTRRLTSDKFRT